MGNIPVYDQPDLGLTPNETGPEAFAAAARRGGAFYNEAGESIANAGERIAGGIKSVGDVAVDSIAHHEIGAGMAHGPALLDGLTKQWNQIAQNADPNDPTVAKKFLEEEVEPRLQQFAGSFATDKGQDWSTRYVAGIRDHMFEKTSADMSTLATIAVRDNTHTLINTSSNTAMSDPSAVPFLLDSVKHSLDGLVGSSPNLRGVDATRLHSELSDQATATIVKAGAFGVAMKSPNPEAAMDTYVQRYPQYISGVEAKQLATFAREQIRARNYDDEITRRRNKEIAQDKSTDATNQYLIDVRSRDPTIANDPTAVKILNDPNLTKPDRNNLLNLIDRQLKPETESRLSQQTFVGLLREMRQPDADLDAVMQKAWAARLTDPGKPGGLSERDFNAFRNEVIDRKTPEGEALSQDRTFFWKQFESTIDLAFNGIHSNPLGLYRAEMDARRQENYLRSKGLDPHLTYDPRSPYFFGAPENLQRYREPLGVTIRNNGGVGSAPSSAPPAQQEHAEPPKPWWAGLPVTMLSPALRLQALDEPVDANP